MNTNTTWRNLGDVLTSAAAKYGERTFLIFGDAHLSFAAANERVDRLAAALQRLGVAKGDRVAVMLPNGFDFPLAWLAIARLGAVIVPTNITYQAHDLHYILADAGASTLLLHADYLPVLAQVRADLPALRAVIVYGGDAAVDNAIDALLAAAPARFTPTASVERDDLLNIQYTSGTTGFPKGCMLTHGYWLLLGEIAADYLQVTLEDIDLTAQPFYYMDPQWNTVVALLRGIPLVILPRFSPSRFWPAVRQHGVTFCYMLGTMPFYLLKQPENPALEQEHNLRVIICSGIHPEFHATFEARWRVPWREAFGMTETGVDLLAPLEDASLVGSGAMGRPVATKAVRIVDAEDRPLPDGEVGEMVVRGQPMMLGYWNNADATAATIRNGWLHTGDLAYRHPQTGYFHLVGRLKDMVRRAGENIAASEVEGVLAQHPAVKLAAVVPVPDPLRGEEVKAYIVLQPGLTRAEVTPQTLIAFARARLAPFKAPRYIAYVDDLPRTPSERIAKHELTKGGVDLRLDSYDAIDEVWR